MKKFATIATIVILVHTHIDGHSIIVLDALLYVMKERGLKLEPSLLPATYCITITCSDS